MRTWSILVALICALILFMWAIDFVTLEGEWTIYTAQCRGGKWLPDESCTGNLEAGERHRFRALKKKSEVVFWDVGSAAPSGKLAPCKIQSRSDWTCTANTDAARSITLEMRHGLAIPPSQGESAFHPVSKWRWFLLKYGP